MDSIDVMISFDTTGSMYPCLTQVRRDVENLVNRLFKDIKGIRIGIIAHGDYCDEHTTYITKMLDLNVDKNKICHFVRNVEATHGGDFPECYEFVLNQVRSASWSSGKAKVFIMIGDATPHDPSYSGNKRNLDWKNETGLLSEAGIKVYAVQCLGRRESTSFYQRVASLSEGLHLKLNQFSNLPNLLMAACFKQDSDEALASYEHELIVNGHMNRDIDLAIGTMLGRSMSERFTSDLGTLGAVADGRFQVIGVDDTCPIKEFVLEQGLEFKKGRGFYEFTKRRKKTKIQDYKEVILMDNTTGDLFTGDKARELAGIPVGVTCDMQPEGVDGYTVFIQSTSVNRALQPDTRFLYEVNDF